MSNSDDVRIFIPPVAVPMTKAPEWLGISRSQIYEEIAAGRLLAKRCGKLTLIDYKSGCSWLQDLPPFVSPVRRK